VKLRLLADAEAEIESARCYLSSQSFGLGTRFLDELDRTLSNILEHPAGFPKLETVPQDEPYQRALLAHFRYAVIFELMEDEILVVAVAHTSRLPNYWLNRRS
jgi:plasmid stabilization system protein ParE